MGIEQDVTKRILGVLEGATENSELVGDLLENLKERGLNLTRRALFVVDGSKALRKAIRDVFGKRTLIQRCQVHKLRNIVSYLPPSREAETRRRLKAAWGLTKYDEARSELRKTLVTTNPIESSFEIVKNHARRVKNWNGSAMVLRWVGTGLVKAERQFRRVRGYKPMPQLIAALENESLSEGKEVA